MHEQRPIWKNHGFFYKIKQGGEQLTQSWSNQSCKAKSSKALSVKPPIGGDIYWQTEGRGLILYWPHYPVPSREQVHATKAAGFNSHSSWARIKALQKYLLKWLAHDSFCKEPFAKALRLLTAFFKSPSSPFKSPILEAKKGSVGIFGKCLGSHLLLPF